MAKRRATLADLLNDLTFKQIYDKYKLIALNRIELDGLPEGIETRHVMTQLYTHGKAGFFRATNMGYMCLEAQDGQGLNVYRDPLSYTMIGNGFRETVPADQCVIIENNPLRLPTDPFIMFYANKLTEAERTMDVNVKANKTPIVVLCDDKTVLSFKAIFQKVDGNVPAIYADKGLNLDAITALDTKVKFLCNDLMDYKKAVENELLTFLGINNTPVEKKERVITSEANSNNQLIASFAALQYDSLVKSFEKVAEMFPDVKVTVRDKYAPILEEGGAENVDENLGGNVAE